MKQDKTTCDILIEPKLKKYTMFDLEYANEIFQIGYNSVNENYIKSDLL